MDGKEVVHVGQSSRDPARERLIARIAQQRVEPDQPVAASLQTGHLMGEQLGFAAIPAITDHQDDGAATQHAPGPLEIELSDGRADPRPAGPIGNLRRDRAQRLHWLHRCEAVR